MHRFQSIRLRLPLLALASLAPLWGSAPITNTRYIKAPELVSTGMPGIIAYVPAKDGARYAWTVTGGAISGFTDCAAVTFTAGRLGTAVLQCTETLAGVATTYVQDVPVVAAQASTPFYYGSGYSADSLANTQVGGPNHNVVSYRFQAKHASALDSIRVFFIWSASELGYAAGLGGVVQVDLMADDHSAAHLPAGPVLASLIYNNIISTGNYYPKLNFAAPATLEGGAIYHLVFTNIDPLPISNYVSVDSIYTDAQTAPMQGCIANEDWAVLVKSGDGAWKLREGFTPTLDLAYADGGHQGNGYMEVWSTAPETISGPASVRETFKVSGPNRTFTKISLRLKRVSGTSPLGVALEEADGTVIEQGSIAASEFLQTAPNWVTLAFPNSKVLASGVGYNLVLTSPADTQYSIYPMRKGSDKGFSNDTLFPDGHAQFTRNGTTWAGWTQWGTPDLTDSDLQFMFVP